MNELEKWQDKTVLPGMWPSMVDATRYNQSILLGSPYEGIDETFTLGALADSTYEYLPKVSSLPLSRFAANENSNICSSVDR